MFFINTTTNASDDMFNSLNARSIYLNYLEKIHSISFTAQIFDRNSKTSTNFTNVIMEKWKVSFDLEMAWKSSTNMIGDPLQPDKLTKAPSYSEMLLGKDKFYSISVNRNNESAENFAATLKPKTDYWNTKVGWGYIAPVFGYLHDGSRYLYIPDLIPEKAKLDISNNEPFLSAENEAYKLQIYFKSSDKKYIPHKIIYERKTKKNEDVLKSMVYSVEETSEISNVLLPNLYTCQISTYDEKHKLPNNIRVIDGKITVVNPDSKEGVNTLDFPAVTLEAKVSLSNIDLNNLTDNDFQFQANIPNGLDVHMQDARHLKYIWQNGKVIPKTDPLNKKDDLKFKNETSTRWFLIINAVAILIIILFFVVIKKRAA